MKKIFAVILLIIAACVAFCACSYNCETCKDKHTVTCSLCNGKGKNLCYMCHGTMRKTCTSCGGMGMSWHYDMWSGSSMRTCMMCAGLGTTSCYSCTGGYVKCSCDNGKKPCPDCQ